jgi:hypothetical protein
METFELGAVDVDTAGVEYLNFIPALGHLQRLLSRFCLPWSLSGGIRTWVQD